MKAFIVSILAVVTIYVIGLWGIGYWSQKDMAKTKAAILAVEFSCPKGTKEVLERAGKLGYARYCLQGNLMHGKWIHWESQRLEIEGNYFEGKHDGQWTWYYADGRKYRVIEYNKGQEVSDRILSKE